MATSVPRVSQGPSRQEWEEIKPIFIQLYVEENKKLWEVQQIFADEIGFVATIKMYKQRIKSWAIRKNYTAAEKDDLAQYEESLGSTRNQAITFSVRGKPVKWDRVYRYKAAVARQRRVVQPVDRGRTLATRSAPPQPAMLRILQDEDEIILRATRQLVWRQLSIVNTPAFALRYQKNALLYNNMYRAFQLLRWPVTAFEGWKIIKSYCNDLRKLIETDFYLVWEISTLMTLNTGWDRFAQLRDQLLSFLSRLSSIVLPTGNPLKVLAPNFTNCNRYREVAATALLVQFDVVSEASDGFINYDYNLGIDTLRRMNLVCKPEVLQKCGGKMLQKQSLSVRERCNVKIAMANSFVAEKDFASALERYHAILDEHEIEPLHLHYLYVLVGNIYERTKDIDNRIHFGELALETSVKHRGAAHNDSVIIYHELENVLIRFERYDELRLLRLRYPMMRPETNNELRRVEEVSSDEELNLGDEIDDQDALMYDDDSIFMHNSDQPVHGDVGDWMCNVMELTS